MSGQNELLSDILRLRMIKVKLFFFQEIIMVSLNSLKASVSFFSGLLSKINIWKKVSMSPK